MWDKFLIVGIVFNLAKVITDPCMCQTLSLSDSELTVSWRLDSLAYVESITDSYSQYFAIDIEYTENNINSVKSSNYYFHITWTSYCLLLHSLPLIIW